MLKTSSLVTLINTLNYPDIYSLRSHHSFQANIVTTQNAKLAKYSERKFKSETYQSDKINLLDCVFVTDVLKTHKHGCVYKTRCKIFLNAEL